MRTRGQEVAPLAPERQWFSTSCPGGFLESTKTSSQSLRATKDSSTELHEVRTVPYTRLPLSGAHPRGVQLVVGIRETYIVPLPD